jgi:hypothetical protein
MIFSMFYHQAFVHACSDMRAQDSINQQNNHMRATSCDVMVMVVVIVVVVVVVVVHVLLALPSSDGTP